ncbi:S-adenosylmethionine transporter [Mitosporidium daphniae]
MMNDIFKANRDHFSLSQTLISSVTAELCASVIRTPAEIVKQRRQAHLFGSTYAAFNDLLKKAKGSRMVQCSQLYRGFIPTIIRDISFAAIQFVIYEYNKNLLSKYISRPLLPSEASVCGCIAGGISAAITTPLDVLKTRTMLNLSPKEKIPNVFVLGTAILNKEGARSLLHGLTPRVAWMTIGGGIFFGAYEQAKSFLS